MRNLFLITMALMTLSYKVSALNLTVNLSVSDVLRPNLTKTEVSQVFSATENRFGMYNPGCASGPGDGGAHVYEKINSTEFPLDGSGPVYTLKTNIDQQPGPMSRKDRWCGVEYNYFQVRVLNSIPNESHFNVLKVYKTSIPEGYIHDVPVSKIGHIECSISGQYCLAYLNDGTKADFDSRYYQDTDSLNLDVRFFINL